MSAPTGSAPTGNENKRRRDDSEQTDQIVKKTKDTKRVDVIGKQLEEAARELREWLTGLQPFATQEGCGVGNALKHVNFLLRSCSGSGILEETADFLPWFEEPLTNYFTENPTAGGYYAIHLKRVRLQLKKVLGLMKAYINVKKAPPSASAYALSTYWHYWQDQETAILNLRPRKNQSLPLCTLHPTFAQFISTYEGGLPTDLRAPLVHGVAHALCLSMSEKFETGQRRAQQFIDDIHPLLTDFLTEVPIESKHRLEAHASKVDLLLGGIILGEVKAEFSTGDPYMQVARSYQAIVHKYVTEGKSNDGFPHFLICLLGPILFIAGGFFDGERMIVEPLTDPCLMLPDYSKRRQNHLIRMLHATREAFETLKLARSLLDIPRSVANTPATAGTPRVYPLFLDWEGHDHTLTFLKRLADGNPPPPNLLFLATSPTSPQKTLLVKLVELNRYGVEAHRTLAKSGFAPELFGKADLKGSFTAIVMEYLDSSDGWMTLSKYKEQNASIEVQHPQLVHLLHTMKEQKVVHGDLRPVNIMVRERGDGEGDRQLEVKVIDFDWAGTYGDIRYPLLRNPEIPWPGKAGELIGEDDDGILLERTLRSSRST